MVVSHAWTKKIIRSERVFLHHTCITYKSINLTNWLKSHNTEIAANGYPNKLAPNEIVLGFSILRLQEKDLDFGKKKLKLCKNFP